MYAVRKTLALAIVGLALSACDAAMTQGVGQATQGLLPQIAQGAATASQGGDNAQSGGNAQGGTGAALAQVAAGMLSGGQADGTQAGNATATSVQPSPALANSSEVSFFSKSGLQACGGGALAGVVTCKITKTCDSSKSAAKAAFLGCGIGMGANYYLEYQRGQYADSEQRIDALIADVKADNQKLQTLTQQAQQVLAADKNTLAQLQQGIQRKTVERSAAHAKLAQVDANTQALNKTLADLKSRQQQWLDVANQERGQSPKAQALDAEIGRMQKQIVNLEQNVDSVEKQRAGLALG